MCIICINLQISCEEYNSIETIKTLLPVSFGPDQSGVLWFQYGKSSNAETRLHYVQVCFILSYMFIYNVCFLYCPILYRLPDMQVAASATRMDPLMRICC